MRCKLLVWRGALQAEGLEVSSRGVERGFASDTPGRQHTNSIFLQPEGLLVHAPHAYPHHHDPFGVAVRLNRYPGVSIAKPTTRPGY